LIGVLLTNLTQKGKRVAYYRPFSSTPENDPDVNFFAEHLLVGYNSPPSPRPFTTPPASGAGPTLSGQLSQDIRGQVETLSASTDVVLVESPDLTRADGSDTTLPGELASLLGAKVLLVLQYVKGLGAEAITRASAPLGDNLAGVIINSFPVHRRREIQQELVQKVRERGIPILGAIPDDRSMLAVTVQQIADHLGGRWVQEPVNTDAYVDRFLIGGNIMDNGLCYLDRFPHQAVITRSERPDIQMACLATATRCLVLTGGAQPTEYVRVEALQREVPLILVDGDTISTAEALNGLLEQANAHSLWKIQRFAQLVQEHLDTAALDAALG
jgi:BioD-like phosphotransacetylase family protein